MKFVKDEELENEFKRLVGSIDNGEIREKQIELSKKISSCINKHLNGIYQAGCGIGKSFAYLIPAILSERKIVISTATRQLSSQIANKDLKILQEILFPELKYCEIQGAQNYICLQNFDNYFYSDEKNPEINLYIGVDKHYEDVKDLKDEEIIPELKSNVLLGEKLKPRIDDIKFLYKLRDQIDLYYEGSMPEKDFLNFSLDCSPTCLREISCQNTHCSSKGKVCEFLKTGKCPYRKIIDNLEDQDIVVTNHAFAGAYIGISNNNFLFRNRDLWIADEGHELEQYLIKSFSNEISTAQLSKLMETLFYPGIEKPLFKAVMDNSGIPEMEDFKIFYYSLRDELTEIIDLLRNYSKMFKLDENKDNSRLPDGVFDGLRNLMKSASKNIKEIQDQMQYFYDRSKQFSNAYFELTNCSNEIKEIAMASHSSCIFWIGCRKRVDGTENITLHSTNIKIGEKLQAFLGSLDPKKKTIKNLEINENLINLVTLSATMKIGSSFREFEDLISADKSLIKYDSFDAGTVFNLKEQGILYIPNDIPDVKTNREAHFKKFIYETVRLINSSNGGALVLCTTSAEAEQSYEIINKLFGNKFTIFHYKDSRNKDEIINKFRSDHNSILIGTKGFFQGIDIQGTSLRLVCINKIPFPTPDCVSEAKSKIYSEEGKNAFKLTSIVPATQILLQAIGRLIRHTTDNGVVMIADNRINESPFWLQPLINSIPDFQRTSNFNEVNDFFTQMNQIL